MNEEKNKSSHIIILIISIIAYMIIFMLQGPMSAKLQGLTALNGVLAQFQVVICTILVTTNLKRGFITTCILSIISALSALLSVLSGKNGGTSALPGVFVALITIVTMSIIYIYLNKSISMQKELNEKYEEIIDSNRKLEEKDEALRILAYTDRMTGMANSQYFYEKIEESSRSQMPFTVIHADADNFKYINDQFGPKTGDTVLMTYAERIIGYCGQKYICARTGGDEFSILVTGEQTEAEILNIVNQLRSLFSEPVNVQGMMLGVTISCGVVTYPRDGRNVAILMDNAIIATYNAKANGKDRTCFFSPSN